MKTIAPYLMLIIICCSCSSDDNAPNSILEGRTYNLTEFNIAIPADLNDDGEFSTNLLLEEPVECINANQLTFNDGSAAFVLEYSLVLDVDNTIQQTSCIIFDYVGVPSYSVNDNGSSVEIEGDEGVIDGENIIFQLSNQRVGDIGNVLTSEGTTVNYDGFVELVFTLSN